MPPFPNIWRIDLTFDLDLWHTDLKINRDHLFIKDYLPTKFEASGAKRSWVIRCTRFGRLTWPLTLTFDLLTWISIEIIYSSRTIYLPSLKLLGQKRSWVIRCTRFGRLIWPLTLTFDLLTWLSIRIIYLSRTIYLPSLKLLGQSVPWVISCIRLRDTDIPTDRPTCATQYAPPSSKGGIINNVELYLV